SGEWRVATACAQAVFRVGVVRATDAPTRKILRIFRPPHKGGGETPELLRRVGALLRTKPRVDVGDAAAQLLERLVDVDLLALQRVDALGELFAAVHGLRDAAVMDAVEIEDLADLGERKADAPSAQDEDD